MRLVYTVDCRMIPWQPEGGILAVCVFWNNCTG